MSADGGIMVDPDKSHKNHKRETVKASLYETRKALPVWALRGEIVQAVQKHAVTVIVGETGSGKTTQIPQFLLQAKGNRFQSIVVTQPRRISAISLAQRVAQEYGCQLGTKVGYSVRFDNLTSASTSIKFATDGMLLRELLVNPLLSNYNVLVIDEAHERSVRTDVLLGMVKNILNHRTDIRVVIMSATLEADMFTRYFTNAHVLHVPGRLHEIRVFHALSPVTDYVDGSLRTIYDIHHNQAAGDILAFFNGQEDIEAACCLLNEHGNSLPGLIIIPMFANLPMDAQRQVFEPAPPAQRKVILATNIAETSITIPGVRYVVDNGLAKLKIFDPKTGIEALLPRPISQAAALQRAGRAGREGPGRVYRLYTESAFEQLETSTPAELLRADLAHVVLQLLAAGVKNILKFDFIEPPSRDALMAAYKQLLELGALDRKTRGLGKIGRLMVEYPLPPLLSRILVSATITGNVSQDTLTLLALLSQDSLFYTPTGGEARENALERRQKFISSDGDLITWLNVMRAYREENGDDRWCQANFINQRNLRMVHRVEKQLREMVQFKVHVITKSTSTEALLQSYLYGYFGNVAYIQPDGRYITLKGKFQVSIHPSSVLFGKKIPVVSFVDLSTAESGRWFIRGVSRVDQNWIKSAVDKIKNDCPGFSDYKVGRVIGEGSYAQVKEAYHIVTNEKFACKIFNKKLLAGREHMVLNEISILKNVSQGHPNLIHLVDYFESTNNLYLVMDLCRGGELFYRICNKGHYFEKDAAQIVRTIIDAVVYLHDKGIVHRDLKPENLIFRTEAEDSDLLIADFGLARCMESDQYPMLTTTCGTPGFMSPEILQRLAYGKPVDMWAIGVITYFLLSGYTPFDRDSTVDEIQAIIKADFAFEPKDYWAHVTDSAKDFIRNLLKLEPKERMTARQALQHAWIATLSHKQAPMSTDQQQQACVSPNAHNLLPQIRANSSQDGGGNRLRKAVRAMQAASHWAKLLSLPQDQIAAEPPMPVDEAPPTTSK